MQFWALIVDSFRESIDRKIFWVLVVISVLVAAAMFCVGIESDRITLCFGLWELQTDHYDPLLGLGRSHVIGFAVYILLDMFLGWIGIVLMLIATGGIFPALMERGAIDVVVSKPIGRHKLFLYKYLASMVFVFVQALFFVGLTFLVMGFRWGVWAPGYVLAVPLLVLLFSYIYCVSVLVAVKTKSTVAAILLAIGAWVLFATPTTTLQFFETFPSLQRHERLYQVVRVVSWIPPKTAEFPYIVARWAQASTSVDLLPDFISETSNPNEYAQLDGARKMEEKELAKNPVYSIGSSLIFECAIVLWAMSVFVRKDY